MSTPADGPDVAAASLARPISFEARYGSGQDCALVLGGGGVYFVAWQVTYLETLRSLGVDWDRADSVVGTSAGSLVAAALTAGRLGRLGSELSLLAKVPALTATLAPAGELAPSQQRALSSFLEAGSADPSVVRAIGHAALAAQTPAAAVMARNIRLMLGFAAWRSASLAVTATDAWSGERVVVTAASGVNVPVACAASSAVPGLFAPQQVGDRRCMDGGVSGSGTHTDLVAGAQRAVVISLSDGSTLPAPTMTLRPESFGEEIAALRAAGTEVLTLVADPVRPEDLMDPATVPDAIAAARRRAATDADAVRAFWQVG